MRVTGLGLVIVSLGALACGTNDEIPGLPVADAGFDQTVRVGTAVTLDGSQSHTINGGELTYAWTLVSIPDGSTATLASTTTSAPTFTTDAMGIYLVALVVTNQDRASLPDVVAVTAVNRVPYADACCSQVGNLCTTDCEVWHGREARLSGSASFDPDGDTLTYHWTQITGVSGCSACPDLATCLPADVPVTIVNSAQADASFTAPDQEDIDLVFKLDVADDLTTSSTCVAVSLTNLEPVILNAWAMSTSSSAEIFNINKNETFRLRVDADDPNTGDALTYSWTQNPAIVTATIQQPDQAITQVVAPDVTALIALTFRVVVSDGIEVDSKEVTITIDNL